MPPTARSDAFWAVGPVTYLIAVASLGKLARVAELSQRLHSLRPLRLLPAALGQDILLVGLLGLVMHALARLRPGWLRLALGLMLLVPVGVLVPADVLSQRLTGRPLTVQRLRGDEGATLKDLDLLAPRDLIGGLLGIAVALLLLWAALRFASRSRILQRVASVRSLLVLVVVGFGANLAQAKLLPRMLGLEEQPVFILLGSVVEHDLEGLSLSEAQWRALYAPSERLPPPPPAPEIHGHPKNIVIFAAEGIPYKDTGFDPRFGKAPRPGGELGPEPWPDPTPNLTRRAAAHGVVFDRYYATWHSSIQAIFSLVCSRFPPLNGDIVRVKPRIDCGELSETMKAHGLRNGLFHAGQFAFYNKLALLGGRGFEIELDAEELKKTSKRQRQQWGIDDRAMVDATLKWIDTIPRDQPFMALLIAVTAHYPYWVPKDFAKPFHGNSLHARFLNAVAFQDAAFEQLVRGFEERGRYDDTLFVWLGDHGHYVAEPARATPGLRGFYEPNLHTPLLLLSSKMFPRSMPKSQRRNGRLGSHIDLLPTLLDALGLPPDDSRHEGQSLLSPRFENRRVFFGAADGRYIGFIEGTHKFALNVRNGHFEYYDLARDPDELNDLGANAPAEKMASFSDDAMRFARGMETRIAQAPVLDETISVANVYDLFLDNVQVKTEQDGKLTACPGGEHPDCPGLGKVLRVATQRIQGSLRKCMMVRLPTQGPIELTVTRKELLDLLTGTILATPNTPEGRPAVRVEVTADAQKPKQMVVSTQGADRPYHPKATRELRFRFAQQPGAREPAELCLQLTTLVEP